MAFAQKVNSFDHEVQLANYLKQGKYDSESRDDLQEALPAITRYPDQWQAYVEDCLLTPQLPPEWFLVKFLERLGYNHFKIKVNGEHL